MCPQMFGNTTRLDIPAATLWYVDSLCMCPHMIGTATGLNIYLPPHSTFIWILSVCVLICLAKLLGLIYLPPHYGMDSLCMCPHMFGKTTGLDIPATTLCTFIRLLYVCVLICLARLLYLVYPPPHCVHSYGFSPQLVHNVNIYYYTTY